MAQNKRIGWKSTRETAWFICKDFERVKVQLRHWVLAPRQRNLKKTHVVAREALTPWLPLSTVKQRDMSMFLSEGQEAFVLLLLLLYIYLF